VTATVIRPASLLTAGAALMAMIGLPACGRDAEPSPEAGTSIAVTVQPARLDTLRDVVLGPGTVAPAASGDFTAVAAEPATVVELPKAEGDAVQAGDVLVRLEVPALTDELTARQLEFTAAKTKADAARADADRNASLHERGLIARNVLEASRIAAADAATAVTEAQSRLDAIKAQDHRTTIRARFPGIVAKTWKIAGDYVAAPGEPILRVIDPNKVQIVMQVPLADFQRVLPGQQATVQPAIGGPPAAATVTMRTPPADPMAATAEVRLDLTGPSALTIETPVQVEVLVEERRDVLTVPASAVQRDGATAYVWIAGNDAQAHRREVRVGITAGGRTQVTDGVQTGERVIVSGIAELTDGAAIRVS
jgi:RND family efflux transporter MFP subunit